MALKKIKNGDDFVYINSDHVISMVRMENVDKSVYTHIVLSGSGDKAQLMNIDGEPDEVAKQLNKT